MAKPADRHLQGAANPGARTAWVASSVGPQLRIAAKSARTLLERHLSQAGASFGNWTVLAVLDSGGPMIQRVLAGSLGIEGPTLTRHLDRLEELGLIQRNRTGADRRYALVGLTAAGQTLCHELDAIARAANDQLLTGFSDEEIAQLTSMLQRLTRNAQRPLPGAGTGERTPARGLPLSRWSAGRRTGHQFGGGHGDGRDRDDRRPCADALRQRVRAAHRCRV